VVDTGIKQPVVLCESTACTL